ncbi:glycosyltransferase family 2 protein [Pseudescherichia vulneris]
MSVSIVITLYNRKDLVVRAIDSVSALAKMDGVEIIVIDDGSTDNPLEILSSYITDEVISYHYKVNGGAADAKNYGANIAKGEYVIFLDSDDYLVNSFELVSFIKNNIKAKYDFFYSQSVIIKKNSLTLEDFISDDFSNAMSIYNYAISFPLNYPGKPTYIFRRERFLGVEGFTTSFKWGDAMLFWRLFLADAKCCMINFPSYVYDQSNDQSISRQRSDNYYSNVYHTLTVTYEKIKPTLKETDCQLNWVLILWLLSARLFKSIDFLKLSFIICAHPLKAIKAAIYIMNKRKGRHK